MPPSTRANVPVVDDEAAESSAEQHASRPLLNIDMAVNAAVERQFEQHSAEMIERMLAALDSRGARSTQPVSDTPAATNGTDVQCECEPVCVTQLVTLVCPRNVVRSPCV